jgi:SAM-dependent methyltransferase
MDDYRSVNRSYWDARALPHAESDDYGFSRFIADPAHLSDVVRFDLPRLGDIAGLRGVHLQCHIGTDTLSLARLGARMTGLDLSEASLAQARRLAEQAGADIDYVQSELYDALSVLEPGSFDLVYTGVGALCWLPDVQGWAQIVAALLRPGGRLFIREGHPMLWAVEEGRQDGLLVLEYPYFERPEPDVFDDADTYVQTDMPITSTRSHSWNHGLGEIVTAVMGAGMSLTMLQEHDSVPWEAFAGHMERVGPGEWRVADRPWRLPHSYTLQAIRTGS